MSGKGLTSRISTGTACLPSIEEAEARGLWFWSQSCYIVRSCPIKENSPNLFKLNKIYLVLKIKQKIEVGNNKDSKAARGSWKLCTPLVIREVQIKVLTLFIWILLVIAIMCEVCAWCVCGGEYRSEGSFWELAVSVYCEDGNSGGQVCMVNTFPHRAISVTQEKHDDT